MDKVYTCAAMRAADEYTIEELNVPSSTLMERAGKAIADAAEERLKNAGGKSVLSVCGGGNNGGDGFCAARLLSERGYEAEVYCIAERFSKDCLEQKEKFKGTVLTQVPDKKYDVVIDALCGTGFSGEPNEKLAKQIDIVNTFGKYVVSADIPSGLNGDTGEYVKCVKADETVAIGELKSGHFLAGGQEMCGKATRKDIGIDIKGQKADAVIYGLAELKDCFPFRKKESNKGDYGRASVLAGSLTYSGAPFLTAGAALRCGCGYVRLAVPDELFPYCVGKIPEVILTSAPSFGGFLKYDEDFLKMLAKASDAIAFGMGCGTGKDIYESICFLLKEFEGVLILDADALGALAKFGTKVLKEKNCKVILTPHMKEFSRLTGKSVDLIRATGTQAAREFAAEYDVTVLLKNNVSVISDGTKTALNTEGTPALAKGGSGDVLSGIICSLAARGVTPFMSAVCGAYLLGNAGIRAEQKSSEYSVIATDVIECLSESIRKLQEYNS